jgi:uncharacterized protein (UPF0332 family)
MARNTTMEMLDVAKSNKGRLETFKRGVHLESRLQRTIDDLKVDVCVARWSLAVHFLQYAKKAYQVHPKQSRLVIGRAYYSMYHAARTVVFLRTGGDDHEAHSVLPQHLPQDFPNLQDWQNKLRTARLDRNRADYDPYPKTEKAYAAEAAAIYADAGQFIAEARTYLIARNVPI